MEIWLKCGKEEIQLPILPPTFEVSLDTGHGSITVHTFGEVLLLGKRGLKTLELSSFFPGQEYNFAQYKKDRAPIKYVNKINGWLEKVIRVIITGSNVNRRFVITAFKYSEDSTVDVNYTLSLKEYRMPTLKSKRSQKDKDKTYTVKKGDTLKSIAKKMTGSSKNASNIYKKNKSIIEKAAKKHKRLSSKNGKYLYPGTKLVIPK